MTDGGVPEDLPGRLCLPGWVQLVLGSSCAGGNRVRHAETVPTTR